MGDTNCMRQLASCYESGCGVPQDFRQSSRVARKGNGNHLNTRKDNENGYIINVFWYHHKDEQRGS